MKNKLLAILATSALALPALAQTTVLIGGPTLNGDLEAGSLGDFAGNHGGTISTSVFRSGAQSVCVDLTANNGEGQWKALCDTNDQGQTQIDVAFADDTKVLDASVWVYVPAATAFGGTTNLNISLEASSTGTVGPYTGIPGSFNNLTLSGLLPAQRDTWIQLEMTDIVIPAGTTNIRTRPFNIQTTQTLAGATINASNTDDFGGAGLPIATPADWVTAGWNGFVYLDDFELTAHDAPPPPDPAIIVLDDVRNGDFEGSSLTPWNPELGGGAIETTIVHDGTQSMSIDLGATHKADTANNRWRAMRLGSGALPVAEGDRIVTSAWVYLPDATGLATRANVNFNLRSNKDATGQGQQYPPLTVNLKTQVKDAGLTDQWVRFQSVTPIVAGDTGTVSTINLDAWNTETEIGEDQGALGYSGKYYLDDVQCVNVGPADPGTLVDAYTRNGEMENASRTPWDINGAGSISRDVNHTPGGNQSIKIDLTANNGNKQWKGVISGGNNEVPIASYQKADITAWVYIPSIANGTEFGGTAKLNLPIRDGGTNIPGAPTIDLTTAPREEWVKVEVLDFDVSGFTTSLAINNWNVETITLLEVDDGMTVQTVRADGKDGTLASPPGGLVSDLPGPSVPQDWINNGYKGCFYLDDVSVRLHSPILTQDISINSITNDGTATDNITINYNTIFPDGVDVYYSDDNLSTWTPDGFVDGAGDNLELTRTSTDPNRFYILVEPEADPPANPNP